MRLERINENQIRCFLSKSDLIERHLKISELAYGSEKAKELFQDMMEQASMDFGFEVDDIPLLIEAIPTSTESIVLVITKVEDPDEFEQRFSHFSPSDEDNLFDEFESFDDNEAFDSDAVQHGFDHIRDLIDGFSFEENNSDGDAFIPLHETLQPNKKKKNQNKKKVTFSGRTESDSVYSFANLDEVIEVAHVLGNQYPYKNTLWKDEESHRYYLYMNNSNKSIEFRQVCDAIGEYGRQEHVTFATKAFFEEHYTLIIRDKALITLSVM